MHRGLPSWALLALGSSELWFGSWINSRAFTCALAVSSSYDGTSFVRTVSKVGSFYMNAMMKFITT